MAENTRSQPDVESRGRTAGTGFASDLAKEGFLTRYANDEAARHSRDVSNCVSWIFAEGHKTSSNGRPFSPGLPWTSQRELRRLTPNRHERERRPPRCFQSDS